jgi:hypothetical protein
MGEKEGLTRTDGRVPVVAVLVVRLLAMLVVACCGKGTVFDLQF